MLSVFVLRLRGSRVIAGSEVAAAGAIVFRLRDRVNCPIHLTGERKRAGIIARTYSTRRARMQL